MIVDGFRNFEEFYPFYLSQHRSLICRQLHLFGTLLAYLNLFYQIIYGKLSYLWLSALFGYSFAWIGHFFFEKNKPATFKYPFYSLWGDQVLTWHTVTGQLKGIFKKHNIEELP